MSALPRPELPPGAAKELNDALHELHHRAGWPSLRTLARETGVSHTTVSKVLSSPSPPELGNRRAPRRRPWAATSPHFHTLWLAASAPARRDATRLPDRRSQRASSAPYDATWTRLRAAPRDR